MSHPHVNASDTTAADLTAASPGNLQQRVTELEAAVGRLLAETDRAAMAGRRAGELQTTVDGLATTAGQLPALRTDVISHAAAVAALETSLPGSGGVTQPALNDVRDRLPVHATSRYPTRDLATIRRIVVHHTVTRGDIPPERIAQVQVAQGKAGITYHYLITSDGAIYWTQTLETVVEQMLNPQANAESVAVALAGNFTDQAPPAAQLTSAAALMAWLLSGQRLTIDAVVGRKEIEPAHGSPGKQWTQGAGYKAALLQAVQAVLDAAGDTGDTGDTGGTGGDDTDVARLQARVRELETTVADLRVLADRASTLMQEVRSLQDTLRQRDADLATLRARVQPLETEVARLNSDVAARDARIRQLEAEIATLKGTTGGALTAPTIHNVVDQLEKHTTLAPYPARTQAISLIAIHHTDTPKTHTPQQIAHYHVHGERRDASGRLIKAQWPGIGYHFLVAADGSIFQCQREETKSNHVGGDENNTSVAVSFIGRFMKTDLKGKPALVEDQLPTPAQLRGAAHLIAWLMQKYDIPLDRVMGHRDIPERTTACPGDQWLTGAKWKGMLQAAVRAVIEGTATGTAQPIEHYLLFWDHRSAWARDDYRNAQDYIAHFRPTAGFSVADATTARHVTIVGGELGVSAADEQRLRAAGCTVYRLAGVDEADTRAKLAALISDNTPWPGASPTPAGLLPPLESSEELADTAPLMDEWTIPPDWPDDESVPATDGAGEPILVPESEPVLDSILVPGSEEASIIDWHPAPAIDTADHRTHAAETIDGDTGEPLPPATVATLGSSMKARQQERMRKAKK